MNRTEFKKRMQSLKSYREQNPDKGYWDWRNSLPDDLPYTDDLVYDMRGAYESGAQPELQDDGTYHLPTRDSRNGRILKKSMHPTYWKGLEIDAGLDYNPYFFGNVTYTWNDKDGALIPWQKVEQFQDGGQSQRRELGDSPYEDPRIEDRFKPRFELRKEPVSYYGNAFTKLVKAVKPVNVLGTIGEFVQNIFPSKEQEYLNDIDTYFDKQARGKIVSSIQKLEDGGEVPPDNSPVHVNPFTKKPLANGAITPVLDLEGAANFTPAGEVLSIRDAYVAAKNNDLLGLGLAGLGFLPFVPRIGRSKVSKVDRPPIPEVHPNYFQEQMEKAEKVAAKRKQTVNDFYTQQDQTYESLIENEDAFRRAVNVDVTAGTNYTGVYGDYLKNYSRSSSRYNDNLTSIRLTDDIPSEAKAQVDPRNLNQIRVNSRYADPDELDPVFQQMNPGLVRHELGHVTDEKAGLDYVNKLGNRSKFESESKLKEMFPKTYKRVQDYLLRGSEIKSHMNEFRDYLYSIGQYSSTETAKSLRQKLDKYGSNFKNLKILFDAYKNKRQFARDYNTIPLIGTSALGINYYLNQEEQRRD